MHAYYPYPSYTFFSLTLLPMRCTFAVSAWNFSSLHFYGLDTYTTLVYLSYYYVYTPYSYHHFFTAEVHRMAFFQFRVFIILLYLFGYFSPSQDLPFLNLPHSTFPLFMLTTCFFSFSIYSTASYICCFQIFFYPPTTIPYERLSPKCRHYKFLSNFSYFTLGSLISYIIVS